jgi:uncharacterized protein
MRVRLSSLVCVSLLIFCGVAAALRAADTIPAAPTRYFNDYALAVKPETADALNKRLEDFEKQSSNQLLVAIFPRLETETSIEDYTHRIFSAWRPGQQGRNNGAVLFVFLQNKKLRIEVGTGLEGALPDARCKQIISDVIAPRFRAGDYDGGLAAGVDAMIASVKGEYQGGGTTAYQKKNAGNAKGGGLPVGVIFLLLIGFFLFVSFLSRRRQAGMARGGTFTGGGFSPIFLPMGGGGFGGFGGGGGSSGGGGGGDGGGFFSSGGGDSGGGGGASGDW